METRAKTRARHGNQGQAHDIQAISSAVMANSSSSIDLVNDISNVQQAPATRLRRVVKSLGIREECSLASIYRGNVQEGTIVVVLEERRLSMDRGFNRIRSHIAVVHSKNSPDNDGSPPLHGWLTSSKHGQTFLVELPPSDPRWRTLVGVAEAVVERRRHEPRRWREDAWSCSSSHLNGEDVAVAHNTRGRQTTALERRAMLEWEQEQRNAATRRALGLAAYVKPEGPSLRRWRQHPSRPRPGRHQGDPPATVLIITPWVKVTSPNSALAVE